MSARTGAGAGTHRGGPVGWFQYMGASIATWPAAYRRNLRDHPRRTITITILTILAISYPVLNRMVLQPFSRSVFPLPVPDDTTVVFMLIFAVMAIGLNVVIGFAGLLDLGYVAFYALGAYTAAFLASPHWSQVTFVVFSDVRAGFPGIHLPFWFIVPAAAGVAAFFGALLGAPTLRLRGDYLAIVTLGFGEIVPIFFKNLVNVYFEFGPIKLVNANLTGGPLGINPIDAPSFAGFKFGVTNGYNAVYLAMFLVLLAIVVARNLERSRMGRAWIAIREDETAAEMMGVNTVRTKLLAFGLGAAFAGVAGALQASYQGATTSDFFQFSTSILVVAMIILGGIGNIWGALVGALTIQYVDKTLLSWLGNRVNDLGDTIGNRMLSDIQLAGYNFLLFGLALVIMMRFRPEGFLPSRQRAAELHEAPPDQALGSATILEEAPVEQPAVPSGQAEPGSTDDDDEDEAAGALDADAPIDATAPPTVSDESEPSGEHRPDSGEPR